MSKLGVPIKVSKGVVRRLLVDGERMMLVEFAVKKGSGIPLHSHPHEQIGYVVKGKVKMIVGGEELLLDPGGVYHIPPDVEHSGEALEDSVALDVFCPPREEYR